jgi:hypothetical protein
MVVFVFSMNQADPSRWQHYTTADLQVTTTLFTGVSSCWRNGLPITKSGSDHFRSTYNAIIFISISYIIYQSYIYISYHYHILILNYIYIYLYDFRREGQFTLYVHRFFTRSARRTPTRTSLARSWPWSHGVPIDNTGGFRWISRSSEQLLEHDWNMMENLLETPYI